jgi:hypothetical protein
VRVISLALPWSEQSQPLTTLAAFVRRQHGVESTPHMFGDNSGLLVRNRVRCGGTGGTAFRSYKLVLYGAGDNRKAIALYANFGKLHFSI